MKKYGILVIIFVFGFLEKCWHKVCPVSPDGKTDNLAFSTFLSKINYSITIALYSAYFTLHSLPYA